MFAFRRTLITTLAKRKQNLSTEASVAAAKPGNEKTMSKAMAKAMLKAKVNEAKRLRKEARHIKALNAAKMLDAYRRKELSGQNLLPEELSELESKQHRLRIVKAKEKLPAMTKHARITLRGVVSTEKQSLTRKVRRYEKELKEFEKKSNSAADIAEKQMQTESLISQCRENRKVLDGINIEEILECFMFKLKSSNPMLRNALDITPLTPELEKLSKDEYLRRKIFGGQKAASIMRLHLNDITGVILGTSVRKINKEVKKARKSTRALKASVKESGMEESDGNGSISDNEADSNDVIQ
ncbi:hypothetical protein H4R24_002586 [Coemansia sp. RSA 988]|nr:hypothetical protein H4R24_002586 [Coemansia sp. RSA 988]